MTVESPGLRVSIQISERFVGALVVLALAIQRML